MRRTGARKKASSENIHRLDLMDSMGTICPDAIILGVHAVRAVEPTKVIHHRGDVHRHGQLHRNFYNPERRHSSISYLTPGECEALQLSETQA